MTPEAIELSRRYADILRARGNAERTIDNYLYALRGFAQFLGERPLASATADDIIAYQSAIKAARGESDSSVRVATYALRGFSGTVLERDDAKLAKLPRPREPKRLPEVLSSEEVSRDPRRGPEPEVPGRVHALLRRRSAHQRGGTPAAASHRLPAHADPGRAAAKARRTAR